jgi:hypothetical protein
MALERIVLNIIPEGEMPVFHCSQYENGRPVIIDLVSSDDDAFLVPEGATVELHCRKVDDNIVTLEPNEVDNNTVTFVSTEQLTACPGDNLCEVVLYADTDPVQTIATLNFILHVEPDPLEGGLTSETQIYNLTQQIEEITQQVIGDDYYNKTEVDDLLDDKADKATTYTKSEVDTALNLKADKATTYTKSQVDSALALKADKSDTYTKTQVDNALALKANTADLATVATTGDYDDLINKPSIPAAQVQSDYAQADNTQVDYIKNKPDIDAMIAAALLEVMPVGTASGPIASFDTELAVPLVNVSCDIVATGGNGTPDNPNPINGYTEANVTANGDTVTIAFGQTVYGGVLDVTRGKLHVTHGIADLSNTSKFNFTYDNISKRWQSPFSDIKVFAQRSADVIAEQWQADTTAAAGSESKFFTVGGALYFYTADNVNKPVGNLVYPLKTPFDIDLTPEVILAIVGTNNVYSDTNGDTTVQFKDSIQHYIDQRT